MSAKMFDRQGNSEIVENRKVQQYLKDGWTFSKPAKVEKPKPTKAKKVLTINEEPAKATILEAEATAEVIKPTNKEK